MFYKSEYKTRPYFTSRDSPSLLSIAGLNSENTSSEKAANVIAEIRALNEIIAKFKSLQVDATEYACLKGIVLFKTGKLCVLYCLTRFI